MAPVVVAAPLLSQEVSSSPTLSVTPMLGVTWLGDRYHQVDGDGDEIPGSLGPTNGLVFGVEGAFRAGSRFGLTGGATYSTLEYLVEGGVDGSARAVGGSQNLLRVAAGIRFRARPDAPGYLSAGVTGSSFDIREPVYAPDEEDRVEWGGYAGAGLDIVRGDRRIRVDGRLFLTAPDASPVSGNIWSFTPRSRAWDFALTLGWVFGL